MGVLESDSGTWLNASIGGGLCVCPWKTSLFYKPAQYPLVGHASRNFTLIRIKRWQLEGHYFTGNTIKSVKVHYVLLCGTAIKHYKNHSAPLLSQHLPLFLGINYDMIKRNRLICAFTFSFFTLRRFQKKKPFQAAATRAAPQVSLQNLFRC